jgi:hypothetical protein
MLVLKCTKQLILWYHKHEEINTRRMKMQAYYNNLNLLASTYGSGDYNSTIYNGQATTGNSGTSGPGNSGVLSNTGVMIAGVVTLAAIVLLVAMVVRVWKPPAKPATEVVPIDDDPNR